MIVGVCRIRLRLPESSSLKDKRQVLKAIKDRIKNRFEVSIAEVEELDTWQIATLGVCCVSNDSRHAGEIISRVIDFINDSHFDVEMLDTQIETIPC